MYDFVLYLQQYILQIYIFSELLILSFISNVKARVSCIHVWKLNTKSILTALELKFHFIFNMDLFHIFILFSFFFLWNWGIRSKYSFLCTRNLVFHNIPDTVISHGWRKNRADRNSKQSDFISTYLWRRHSVMVNTVMMTTVNL